MAINLSRGRLISLDVFRGITMFLLVAEGTRLYTSLEHLVNPESFWGKIVTQFTHHPWNGLRFWDLVQPYFMFIVGVAMAFSLVKRSSQGASWMDAFKHILIRCGLLLLFGVMLHCGYSHKLVWELWNVLSQLSFTILVAFLIFKLPIRTQLIISFALLLITDLTYRFFPVSGFNQPFVPDQNFGSWMDMLLMGKLNYGHWVAINCVPTAAHTIWGVLAAKILMKDKSENYKLKILGLAGLIGVVVGYGMDWSGLTPIIKRICTSSFVIVSGGWCLLTLTFLYWLVDILGFQRWTKFFTIVGMNSIFIYLFSETVGHQWFNTFIGIFTNGFFTMAGMAEPLMAVLTALVVLLLEWGLCYWLYKHKILIKI
jgi:predicted acyltransferase